MKVLLVVTLVAIFLGCFVRAQDLCNGVIGYDTCIKSTQKLCKEAPTFVQTICFENGRGICKANFCKGPCPDGWIYNLYTRVCYKVLMNNMNWPQAQGECSRLNYRAEIASLKCRAENDFVKNLLRQTSGINGFWIGLRDVNQEGHWVWYDDGKAATYSDWHRYEPNNAGNEDCALLHSNSHWWGSAGYKWNDAPCNYSDRYGAVCQMPAH